jgi:hypothetical protein
MLFILTGSLKVAPPSVLFVNSIESFTNVPVLHTTYTLLPETAILGRKVAYSYVSPTFLLRVIVLVVLRTTLRTDVALLPLADVAFAILLPLESFPIIGTLDNGFEGDVVLPPVGADVGGDA